MSDLQDKLNQILQNPEAMKQVQSLGAQLGLTGEQKQPPKPKPPENNLMSMIGGDDTIGTIAKFAPLLSSLNNSDDTTRLLDSLRPFLSHERQEKLDKAENITEISKHLAYTDTMVEKTIAFIIENSVLPRIESLQRVVH